ncbi:glycosyltransferase family 4 protein [Bacillus carboniphilus]|uniref:Glycosyltransferase family 4 protein n=1 Tax=Bacillus carboniphilus TaxID=86663 RepID=A0ABN0WG83_9BACI
MKILLATVYDYPHPGGLSTHMTTLKAGLEARGHEVDVLSFSDVPKVLQTIKVRGTSFVLNKISKGTGFIWGLKTRKKMLQAMIETKKHRGYDIVNAQDVYATFAAIDAGLPTVSTVHGYTAFEAVSAGSVIENSQEVKYLQEQEIEAFTKTRMVITVDLRIKNYVKKQADVDGFTIRNFINIDDFKPETSQKETLRAKHGIKAGEKVFFVPRRLTKKNGVIYPILALPKVLEKYPDVKLIYAGSGEALDEMKSLVSKNKLDKSVRILGAIPHKQIKEFYALSDVVLVPSIHSSGVEEATSISALEAMGSGIPLIASAVGGLREIVDHGVDGILVEERNIEALSASMIELLDHPEKGEKLAKAARTKIEAQYSHISAAEKYEQIYMQAIEKGLSY